MKFPLSALVLGMMLPIQGLALQPARADNVPAPATAPAENPATSGSSITAPVGVFTASYTDASTGRTISMTLWYPATGPGTPVTIGGNAVFEGISAERGAPIPPGKHPLVVLTHGGLRSSSNNGAWLAKRLARAGYIVVAEHGPMLGPNDTQFAITEIANRARDISGALDAILANPDWDKSIAENKIAAVGLFLGGTAALSVAGGRIDTHLFADSCDKGGTGMDCAWLKSGGLDLHKADLSPLTQLHRDKRIAFSIAVAPEYANSFEAASLADGPVPVAIVDLGKPGTRPKGLEGASLKDVGANVSYTDLPGVTSYDTFPQCTPKGGAILKDSGSDAPICGDSGKARSAAHAALAQALINLLDVQMH